MHRDPEASDPEILELAQQLEAVIIKSDKVEPEDIQACLLYAGHLTENPADLRASA
ncbi:MAG: hypothetical protein KF760_32595 [Candidatus Eremiobacteraeota bacterium]|nr:hypothetical protein [Candidatus Eremiobacteraeota bacterium]MCW5870327.1 hypothetical protein [Candidatus Eremiobacteraeota bacterium]